MQKPDASPKRQSIARFITFEGVDGAGKSTHIESSAQFARSLGQKVLVTREPGGTELGERLRDMLLHDRMNPETEALLMFAARREHLAQVVWPALEAGTWVVCDRFSDASFAYQGGGAGVDWTKLLVLEQWVQHGRNPDLTILFDLPVDVARRRLESTRELDKFERSGDAYFNRVRAAYLRRAAEAPDRFLIIDAAQAIETIRMNIHTTLAQLADASGPARLY